MSIVYISVSLLFFLLISMGKSRKAEAAEDVAGSQDHPLLSRYDDAKIIGFQVTEQGEYCLPLGKVELEPKRDPLPEQAVSAGSNDMRRPCDYEKLQGKVTKITYLVPGQHSSQEVQRYYEQELREEGFAVLYTTRGDALKDFGKWHGGKYTYQLDFDNRHYRGMYLSFPNEPYYFAARLNTPDRNAFLALYIHRGGSVIPEHKNKVKVQADIIELQPDEAEQVTVETMYEDLHQTGQVTLREIQFEYDSAKLTSESESILAEVAQLLRKHPNLELYVVGHTDDTKSFQYNLELSQRRADAVVEALVEEYDISADRLVAGGVGPQAPVATNETEEGRAQNRRVALVKKK